MRKRIKEIWGSSTFRDFVGTLLAFAGILIALMVVLYYTVSPSPLEMAIVAFVVIITATVWMYLIYRLASVDIESYKPRRERILSGLVIIILLTISAIYGPDEYFWSVLVIDIIIGLLVMDMVILTTMKLFSKNK